MLATPDLLWRGQSLPAATAPAPGPHTGGVELLSQALKPRQLIRIAPGPLPTQVGRRLGSSRARARTFVATSAFSLAASWTTV